MKNVLVAFALSAATLPAAAQTNWYVGIAAGESRTSRELVHNRESTVTLASDFHTDFDDRDGAYRATLGYRLHPRVAIEVDYTDLGTHSLLSNFLGGDAPAPASIYLERRLTGFGADVVLSHPIAKQWSLFARLGAVRTKLEARARLDGNVVFTGADPALRERSVTRYETVPRFGVGTQFDIETCTSLRVEWIRHFDIGKAFEVGGTGTTGEADTDAILVGFVYRF